MNVDGQSAVGEAVNGQPQGSVARRVSLPRNVFSNWTATPFSIPYSLFITPIVVRARETELYGVWSVLNGLLAYSDLLCTGLGAALTRYLAQYHATHAQRGSCVRRADGALSGRSARDPLAEGLRQEAVTVSWFAAGRRDGN
jgi:hypothetical protein